MRLIVARCEVNYSGRLSARLPEALRLLMIKSDGSVMVHDHRGVELAPGATTDSRRLVGPSNCLRFGARPPTFG